MLPTKSSIGSTIVIGDTVYYGGFASANELHVVYCYKPSHDVWTTLPPLPVRWFGMGQVNGELVAVGGKKSSGSSTVTNEIYTYDERVKKWKQAIPPMPTARDFPCVLSLQSVLIVAGGCTSVLNYTDAVEIYKSDTSQWYRTDPSPTPCYSMSSVVIGSTCYILGGYNGSHLNQALYASTDDLLHAAVPVNQTCPCSTSSDTQSAWKSLAKTPTFQPAVAALGGKLFAIGGCDTSTGGNVKKEMYVYSSSADCWIYVSDLPAPRAEIATATLLSSELLVLGGQNLGKRVNSVFRGTLNLKF